MSALVGILAAVGLASASLVFPALADTVGSLPATSIPGSISGRVTDSSGSPVEGVEVSAQALDFYYWGSATTDTEGNYTLSGLEAGDYTVVFSPPDGSPLVEETFDNADGAADATPVSVVAGVETSGVDAQLVTGGSISGRVTDTAGTPLEGAGVSAAIVGSSGEDVSTSTDSDGRYAIIGLPAGEYGVRFTAPTGENFVDQPDETMPADAAAKHVSVALGEETGSVDAQLAEGATISGTVIGEDGRPVGDMSVFVFASDRPWFGGGLDADVTGADGTYKIVGLPAGTYSVWTGANSRAKYLGGVLGGETIPTAARISVVAGGALTGKDITVTEGVEISGTVTAEGVPEPEACATITAYLRSGDEWVEALSTERRPGPYDLGAWTQGAQGWLPAGTYKVGFSASSVSPGCRSAVWADQYWKGATTLDAAAPIVLGPGESATAVDALLSSAPRTFRVTFDASSGSIVTPQEVVPGSSVVEPRDPIREGFTFAGWTVATDGSGPTYDFSSPVTGDITLHAQWTVTPVPAPSVSSSPSATPSGGTSSTPVTSPTLGSPVPGPEELPATVSSPGGGRALAATGADVPGVVAGVIVVLLLGVSLVGVHRRSAA